MKATQLIAKLSPVFVDAIDVMDDIVHGILSLPWWMSGAVVLIIIIAIFIGLFWGKR